jgi:hypothetical protein
MNGLIKGTYEGDERYWTVCNGYRNRSGDGYNKTIKQLFQNDYSHLSIKGPRGDKQTEFLLPLELV